MNQHTTHNQDSKTQSVNKTETGKHSNIPKDFGSLLKQVAEKHRNKTKWKR